MYQDKGLVSGLDRNSEGPCESSALASSTDTSGHPDKVPVLAQRGQTTSEQGAFVIPRTFYLSLASGSEPVRSVVKVPSRRTVSLFQGRVPKPTAISLRPRKEKAEMDSKTDGNSSPYLESRGLLATDVERVTYHEQRNRT